MSHYYEEQKCEFTWKNLILNIQRVKILKIIIYILEIDGTCEKIMNTLYKFHSVKSSIDWFYFFIFNTVRLKLLFIHSVSPQLFDNQLFLSQLLSSFFQNVPRIS